MPDQNNEPEYVVAQWSEKPPTHQIRTKGILYGFINTCPHAQTLEAYSAKFACTVFIPLPCKQWSCRPCAEAKIRRLSVKTQKAKPNRLLTLTVDPSLFHDPRESFDKTRRQVPECMRFLRKRFGECEYLRVTELTKRNWPHYHLMLRSPYIPHSVVKKKWNELTGAQIVDLRQIKGSLNTYTYLVKYLSKMHKIGWTERHVSYSRGFFPEEDKPEDDRLSLSDQTIIESHPTTYLYARFRGATLTLLGPNIFALDPRPESVDEIVAPQDWTNCAVEPEREKLFPPKAPPPQKPPPLLFPKKHEVSHV